MSGHSKWAQIKRSKGVLDARRGQVFTKLAREITVAARQGLPDPDANFRLRLAVQKAREANMPTDNIERAIKRAAGLEGGAAFEEITYEGYGPGGAAILVAVTTDNRNRAAAEIRSNFTRAGGSMGAAGSVAWLFEPKGVIVVEPKDKDPEEMALQAIDLGADDVKTEDGSIEVYTEPSNLEEVREGIARTGAEVLSAEASMVPKTTVKLDDHAAIKVLKLMDRLEELDDVQKVYTNVDFSDEVLEHYAG